MRQKKYYPWIVVALLWIVALLNYMDRQMLSTMQDAIKADITELNKAEAFGALMAVFLWVYGIISPFAGVVADKISRKWLIIASLFTWSAVTFLMGYATSYEQLFYLRAIMGVSEALYIPSALSLIADWHTGGSRSLAVGLHTTGIYTGQAIGGFGAAVAAMFTWHATFHWFGVIGCVYALFLAFTLRDLPKEHEEEEVTKKEPLWKGLSVVLSTWTFWIMLIYFAAPSLPGWATKNWMPTLFAQNLGISMELAGPIATMTISISSFVGVIFGGFLSDRWVRRNICGRIYTSAIGLGLTIPALAFLGFGHSVFAVVCAGTLFGIGYGMFDTNNMPILCQIISARYRATAYGIMNMTGVFAGALVTQVLGKWSDGGQLGLGFAVLGGIVLVAVILQIVSLHPKTDNVE